MAVNEDIAVKVSGVSKSFRLPHERIRSLKSLFINLFTSKKSYEEQKVLKDVSFEVKRGEFFGIVGRNGSGKSTLLKLIAEIYVPDEGSISINGKLTPFIELGVGFNPELTGRENTYLNGALLGFSKRQMDDLYDEIVEFAELEKFMDQKLKNYSSGMQVRLAFSVAIKAQTSILLIDEVLAVGDANFQKKCIDMFETFKEEGRTIIFVSHSMTTVKKFCDRAILIDKGVIKFEGEPDIVATEYDLLNDEKQKGVETRILINNRREAHIVDSVLAIYKQEGKLLEVGSGEGRHVDLLRSMNVNILGIDRDLKKNTKHTFRGLHEIKKTDDITGLLILDNRKSLDKSYLKEIFKELDGGALKSVEKIYVHLPFHLYQKFLTKTKKSNPEHLAEPLDMADVMKMLGEQQFSAVRSSTYNVQHENEYIEAVFERFDEATVAALWG